jgi:DNA-binding CsgD family transcriptional regulator
MDAHSSSRAAGPPPSSSSVALRAPLRGREAEAAALAAAVRAAVDGPGATVLLTGAPGLGKSRLLDEADALAARHGVAVGRGGALPGQLSVPLAPLLGALCGGDEPLLRRDDLRALEAVADQRYWLLQELQELLERRAAGGPVAVLLDDLQWADDATIAALRMLVPALAGTGITWVVAFRAAEASVLLTRVASELRAPGAAVLTLQPLSGDAVRDVVADAAGPSADPAVLRLAGASGGNPFLLHELLAGLQEDGVLGADGRLGSVPDRLPTRLRSTMRERLDGFSARAQDVAVTAAVLGRQLRVDDLAAMLDAAPSTLLAPIGELVRADVLAADHDRLSFRHDLVRDAVLDAVPAAVRHALDRQAADVLLAAGASPVEIATRLAASAQPGDERAIEALCRASRALGASDPATASRLGLKALSLMRPEAPGRVTLTKETALLLHLGGQDAEAHAFATEAMATSLTPAERAEVAMAIATMFTLPPTVRAAAGHQALALADVGDALRAAHAAVLVLNLLADGRRAEAHAAEARASALVAAAGDPAAAAALSISRLGLAYADHDLEAVLAATVRLTNEFVHGAEGRNMRNAVRYFRMCAAAALGRTAEALAQIADELVELRRDRQSTTEPRWELERGRVLLQAGRIVDAQAVLGGVLLGGVIPPPLPIPPDAAGLLALGRAATHTGNAHDARRCDEIARETLVSDRSDGRRHLAWMLALAAMSRQDPDGVREALRLLGSHVDESVLPLLARDPCDEPQLVRAARLIGDPALADRAVGDARIRAERNPGVGAFAAIAAHAEGLRDGDPERLADAVNGLRALDRPLVVASALEDLGARLAVEPRRRDDAIDVLGEAMNVWSRCGASWDARRVRRRLRHLGVRRRATPSDRPTTGWAALTDSQLRVAELVAQGLTNREAAARLYVSPHTVNTHLRQVFARLGLNSRVELARVFAEHEAER